MFFSAFERLMAFRYLRAKRKEGFVSVIAGFSFLGIGLGVATLIIVMSVMNGFRQELFSKVLGINGHIGVYAAQGGWLENYRDILAKVQAVDGVKLAMPLVEGQVMVTSDRHSQGAVVRGISPADYAKRDVLVNGLAGGTIETFSEPDTVFLGERLAQKLGVFAGEEVTLISPRGTVTAFGTVPRMLSYAVGATFSVGMFEYDANFIFMPLEDAQKFFDAGDAVSNIEIFTKDPNRIDEIKSVIQQKLQGYGVRIYDWQRSNATFFNALQVERNVMFLILTLIILVASFNMISGLIMLVKDKGRDIAILRTMGATRSMIMRVFLMSGAAVGFLGTLFGVLFGLFFCDNIENIRRFLESLTGTELFAAEIYFLSRLPAIVNPSEVAYVVLMSLFLSFGSTVYPAWRAARLDPVEALRYE